MTSAEAVEISINVARVRATQHGGKSAGQCMWGISQCPMTVPEDVFFCPRHTATINASADLYVRSTWRSLSLDQALARGAP